MNSPLRSRRAEWLVTMPSFLWLALFFAVPAVIVLAFTFHGHDISGGVGDWSLSTWRELVDPDYPAIIWNTIRISVEVTIWSILLAVPCAYAIARMNPRWRAIVAGSIMLPFWTSFVVRVFAWKTMLHPDGWLQACCNFFTIGGDHSTILDSEAAVVLVSVYSFLPFAIMPIYTAAEKFDFSLLEAARDLGAKNFYAFRKIFLPGVKRGVISAILMVFIPAIGSYVIPDLVGGQDSELIGNKIYQRTFPDRNLPHASALATITGFSVLVPLACVAWWMKRQDEREEKRLAAATERKLRGGAA